MSDSTAKKTHAFVLDEEIAKTAIDCFQKAFATMFGTIVKPEDHRFVEEFTSTGDISGIIGMAQEQTEGNLIVSFSREAIFSLMERIYGKKFTDIDSSVRQGVGELTNIIYSMIKKSLNDRGYQFRMAIPTIVLGRGHSIINLHQGKTLVIPFVMQGSSFHVEIALQQA